MTNPDQVNIITSARFTYIGTLRSDAIIVFYPDIELRVFVSFDCDIY